MYNFFNLPNIDILLTHPKLTHENKSHPTMQFLPRIVARLKEIQFLTDDISHGKSKYMVSGYALFYFDG